MTRTGKGRAELTEGPIREAMDRKQAREHEFEGLSYLRVTDDAHGLSRGIVAVGGEVVPTYPHIGRIFVLREGVRATFDAPFRAEEKIDGYNVRIVRSGGKLLAFTRGGFVCPFTVDRLPDLAELDPLFDEDPSLVLCAEVAGPGNPYLHGQVPHVSEDVAFFGFDLMRKGRSGFVPLDERDALFERHAIPRSRVLGDFAPDDFEGLRRVVLQLDAEGAEGMVLKPPAEGKRVKYVTPAVNLADVVEDASLLAELPGEFFASRIVRLAIGLDELGLEGRSGEMAERMGHALLEDFEGTVRQFRQEGIVTRSFDIRMRSEERLELLLRQLDQSAKSVNFKEISRERRDGYIHCRLAKQYQRSTSWLHTIMRGGSVID